MQENNAFHHRNIRVFEGKINVGHCEAVNRLLHQLSGEEREISPLDICTVYNPHTILFSIHKDNDPQLDPIAIATLVICKPLGQNRAYGIVEDLVVDKDYRGQGLGSTLVDAIIAKAQPDRKHGHQHPKLRYIQLNSSPHRTAANKLYINKGFQSIANAFSPTEGTNLYRMYFD